jgi:hypothetical protein
MAKNTTIKVTYSHAAPYIRQAAAYAASRAIGSETKRDANRAWSEVDGLVAALSILLKSPEGKNQPGEIADEDRIPPAAVVALMQRWGRANREENLFPIVNTEIPEEG